MQVMRLRSNVSLSIGRGIALLTSVSFGARVISLILSLLLIKILKPSELGTFLGIQAMVFAGCAFCDLGLSQAYRMEVSRFPEKRQSYLGLTLLIQGIALVLYFGGLTFHLYNKGMVSPSALFIAIGALISQWIATAEIDLQIFRKYIKSSVITLGPVLGLAIAVTISLMSKNRLSGLAAGYITGMILTGLVAIILINLKTIKIKFSKDYFHLLKLATLFFLSILMHRAGQYWGLSHILISQGEYEAGILGLPLKLYLTAMVLTVSTTGVTLPLFHQYSVVGNHNRIAHLLKRIIGPSWFLVGIFVGVSILSPSLIVSVLANSKYAESVSLIPIFGFAIMIKTVAVPAGNILESIQLQWLRLVGQSISTIALILTILFLLPKLGVRAVAIAMLCLDCFIFLWYWGFASFRLQSRLPWGTLILSALSFLVALLFASLISEPSFIRLLIFEILFVVLMIFTKVLKYDDIMKLLRVRNA